MGFGHIGLNVAPVTCQNYLSSGQDAHLTAAYGFKSPIPAKCVRANGIQLFFNEFKFANSSPYTLTALFSRAGLHRNRADQSNLFI